MSSMPDSAGIDAVFWFVLAAKLMINEGKTYIG